MYYYAFVFSRAAMIPCHSKQAVEAMWGRLTNLRPISKSANCR
jgi:hypothetical protein